MSRVLRNEESSTDIEHCVAEAVGMQSQSTHLLCLIIACALASPFTSNARAQAPAESCAVEELTPEGSEYDRFWAWGACEWNLGRWAAARAAFQLAHELRPSARTWWALGKTAFELFLYREALRELGASMKDARLPLSEEQRAEARGLSLRADAFVGRYQLRLLPSHASVEVDGIGTSRESDGTLFLLLGERRLTFHADGHAPAESRVLVTGRDDELLSAQLKPLPSIPAWVWVAAGSAALGTTSLALYLRARGVDEDLEPGCKPECSTHDRDQLIKWSRGMLGSAIIVGVGSVVLLAVQQRRAKREREDKRARLRLSGLGVSF